MHPAREYAKHLVERFAPSNAVLPNGSWAGQTSTRSAPIRLSPQQPRTNSRACGTLSPPISGVPVPPANAGSMPSMSKLR